MIKNLNETIEYEEYHNKIYIPYEYYNENYKYTLNGDEITIISNLNCRTQYQTTYCTCYKYNERYNVITEGYECNNNPSSYILNQASISTDINDSYRITRDYINEKTIGMGIIIIAILFVATMKKNSRKM